MTRPAHVHGPNEGRGTFCPERRDADGPVGACQPDRYAAALLTGPRIGAALLLSGGPADALVRLSQWIDHGNVERDPEAVTWGRLAKLTEESGEVIAAFIGATGQNPRKGVTHTIADVGDELLDVAVTALGAYEHLTQHQGLALRRLAEKINAVAARAGVL